MNTSLENIENSLFGISGIMGGSIFGNMNYRKPKVIIIYAGDAFSVDTELFINGGTALTRDVLKYAGGTSSTNY